jgi:8-oxo-dGTP pyrophosphatase MutT (NUDIX family)
MSNTLSIANIALINPKQEILLLQRSHNLDFPGYWGLVGGLVDDEEKPLNAALREMTEETDIPKEFVEVSNEKTFEITSTNRTVSLKITVFLATLTIQHKVTIDPYEHSAFKWVGIPQLFNEAKLLEGIPTFVSHLMKTEYHAADMTISDSTRVKLLSPSLK